MHFIWFICSCLIFSFVVGEPEWTECNDDGCCTEEGAGCGDCDEVIGEFGKVYCDCGTCQTGMCHEFLTQENSNAFSASSNIFGMEAKQARLVTNNGYSEKNIYFGWQPDENDTLPWLQVDLMEKHHISGLVTFGNAFGDDFVSAYKVLVSPDNEYWETVDGLDNENGVFIGNSDGNSSAINYFDSPVHMRSLRVYPLTWQSQIVLRIDLLGCLSLPGISATKEPTDVNNINISVYLIAGICFTLLLALTMILCVSYTPKRRTDINKDIPKALVATPPSSIASSPTSASSGDTSFPNPAFATSQKSLLPSGGRHHCETNPYIKVSFPKAIQP
ncbi:lactadherin-like [Antedon mediterranea]|uniref:lactadherin-like n=1 Tax=Antedon mediterranea TaxID=105859 RepID=UPI003AF51784